MDGAVLQNIGWCNKHDAKKSIGKLRLAGIQLQTVLAEVETTLKSRPLIYIN